MNAAKRRTDGGSVTLEATLAFPVVLFVTLALVSYAVWSAGRALLYYSASITAERAAFGWSNSGKDARTGAFPEGEYDSLYWRLRDDGLLASLFGWAMPGRDASVVPLGVPKADGDEALTERKLRRAANAAEDGLGGDIAYRNDIWTKTVTVRAMRGNLSLPSSGLWIGREAAAETGALFVEPPELIRSVDLVRYYVNKFRQSREGAAAYRSQAGPALQRRANP